MKIRWLKAALADLDHYLEKAAARDRQEAHNISARINRTIAALQVFPKSARYNPDKDYYERYVPHTRAVIVYRLTDSEIIVVAVFHTSRSPDRKP